MIGAAVTGDIVSLKDEGAHLTSRSLAGVGAGWFLLWIFSTD